MINKTNCCNIMEQIHNKKSIVSFKDTVENITFNEGTFYIEYLQISDYESIIKITFNFIMEKIR